MALARESGELADEPGGALDAAITDLQRWRRDSEGVTGEVESAVAVLSRLASGKRAVHAALELLSCIALVLGPAMGWGRQAAGAHHTGDELKYSQRLACMRRVVWTYTLHLR